MATASIEKESCSTRNGSRARSPDEGGPGDSMRKRRRKVLSCIECRRRKLQCDRIQPVCSRCAKAGHSDLCHYVEDASELPDRDEDASTTGRAPPISGRSSVDGLSRAPTNGVMARLEFQESRIKQLEGLLSQTGVASATLQRLKNASSHSPESASGVADIYAPVQECEPPLLRGRSFKTIHHGNTHPGATIGQIADFAGYTREVFEKYPALLKIREDCHELEARVSTTNSKLTNVTDDDLRALLPSKQAADELLEAYFKNYGNLYQVLHIPSFWKEYESMWSQPSESRPAFIAIVLCLMASAQCVASTQPWLYTGLGSVARGNAVTAITAVEDWLSSQSQKHVTAASFQIRVLLAFAKQVSAYKFKRRWTECGELVRFCMSAGLHRNPDHIRKETSLLDKELRKRVWHAATEMELQAAFDRGMLSTPWILQSDSPPPAHIADEDISETTARMPVSRKSSDFSSNSYLAIAAESMTLRTSINTNLNSIRQLMSFDDVKRYTDEIEVALHSVPQWTSSDARVPKAMLSLNLLQYLLEMHTHHMRHTESQSELNYCRMSAIDAATRIIDIHRSLTSQGCYAIEILRSDHLRAAFSICYMSASLNPKADNLLGRLIDQTRNKMIPEVIDLLTDKVHRFGCEMRFLWILSAVSAFVASLRDPAKRQVYMQEAVDRITRPHYEIMACQAEPSSTSLPLPAPGLPVKTQAAAPKLDPLEVSMQQSTSLPLADFNFDDLTAWTFDEFFLNPQDLMSTSFAAPHHQSYDMNSTRNYDHL